METTRTIVLKLHPTAEQATELDTTPRTFASACDHIANVDRREHTTNKVLIQRVCYHEVREMFGLSANLAIRAIARVCGVLKVPEKAHSAFKPTSIDYDAQIFSFREWDWTVSLTLLHSQQRDQAGRTSEECAQGDQAHRRPTGEAGGPVLLAHPDRRGRPGADRTKGVPGSRPGHRQDRDHQRRSGA